MTSLSIIKSTVGTGQLTKIQRAYKVIAPAYDWLQPLWTGRALGHAEQFLEQRVIPQYCPSVAAVLDMGCGTGANNELVRTYRRHYTFLPGLQKLLLMLPNSWLTRILELISYRPIFNFILEWHQRHAALESVLKRDAPWETRCTLAGAERSRQTDRGRTAVVHCKGGGNQNR